jgi:hypothetical protein
MSWAGCYHSHMKVCDEMLCAAVSLLLMTTGCSSFNHEWRRAAKNPDPVNDITGRWEGHWKSQANEHHDAMRCLVTRVDASHYDAKFRAAYKKWITVHFGYTVRLETQPATNGVTFHGAEDLGKLAGGVYTYDGRADATNFFSTYKSKYDWGTFEMKRPAE